MICSLCLRDCPVSMMQRHHLRTRRADRALIELICRDCHSTIHNLFSNKELADPEKGLDSPDALLANEQFYKAIRFIRKVPPGDRIQQAKTNRLKKRPRKGRRPARG